MAWKEMNIHELAKSLGINPIEVREKHKLIELIIYERKKRKLSQAKLAKKLGITQSRMAQIESGIGTARITFDILLNILLSLGYKFKIVSKKSCLS